MKFIIDHLVNLILIQLMIHFTMKFELFDCLDDVATRFIHLGSTGTADHPNALMIMHLQHFVVE